MMTKKDFEAIAFIVSCIESNEERYRTAVRFYSLLVNSNPRFNITRFIEACDAEEPVE